MLYIIIFIACTFQAVYGQDVATPRLNSQQDMFVIPADPGDILFRTAKKYEGVQENTINGRKQVLQFLKKVKINYFTSWCAAFASYCLDEANLRIPKTRSALATNFINKTSIKAQDVLIGKYKITRGYLAIWRRGTTIFGHIEIVDFWKKRTGASIGGNTTPPKTTHGKEYDGDGIYLKSRSIQPANYFRIVSFTPTGW